MKNALRPNGIVCCQGEDNWYCPHIISEVLKFAGEIFPSVSYALSKVPSFPAGTCGYILCSLEAVSPEIQVNKFKNFQGSNVIILRIKDFQNQFIC